MFDNIIRTMKVWVNSILNSIIGMQTARAVSQYREYPPEKTAVLLLDTQTAFFDGDDDLISQYAALIKHARENQYLVVYSTSSDQVDTPYPPPARRRAVQELKKTVSGADIPPAIAANSKEIVVANRARLSAFADPRLEQHLLSNSIEHLVIAGPLTNTTLDSTVRDAAQRDLHVTVIDGLYRRADTDASKAELKNTLPRYAHHVMDVDEFKSHAA